MPSQTIPVCTNTEPAVYLLSELSWGDDSYGEPLPVAGLYRITENTLNNIDRVIELINNGTLTADGGCASIPEEDVAWLSHVGFTSENALASLPGFFDSKIDKVIHLSDSANMEIDGVRADYSPCSEQFHFQDDDECLLRHSGLRIQRDNDLGLVVSVTGWAYIWRMGGYRESWLALREKIVSMLIGMRMDSGAVALSHIRRLSNDVFNSESCDGCEDGYTVVARSPLMKLLEAVRDTDVFSKAHALKPAQDVLTSAMQTVANKFRVLGAHPNGNFFDIEVEAHDGLKAFGVAALVLNEANEEEQAELFAAIPAGATYYLPGDGVVTLKSVLDPDQAYVFGLE